MNRKEAKDILLIYRHGTADAEDPQVAEALALAERDPELKDWLVVHCAREFVVRGKFRRISAPAGLKEQIISEQAAQERMNRWRKTAVLAAATALLLIMAFGSFWVSRRTPDDTLAIYQSQMAGIALRGYAMDVMTNNPAAIRTYLEQNHAPADFVLPDNFKQLSLVGCAIEGWQDVRVSMICFRTSQAPPEAASDVWLFVVKRSAVKQSSAGAVPQLAKINRLMTATWVQGDKLYFLGTADQAQKIQQYL